MRTPAVEPEAAVGRDEAIRAEIRAQLRAPNADEADAPMGRTPGIKIQDTAALRLLSGCA
jgi:hypothetical protein